jgi:hypothetical protein
MALYEDEGPEMALILPTARGAPGNPGHPSICDPLH